MNDPVVISSGVTMDRSSIHDENGNLRLKKCPFSRQDLRKEVFPLNYLKSKIIEWNKAKFQNALNLCKEFKLNPV